MKTEDKRKFLYTDLHEHAHAVNYEAQANKELVKLVLQVEKVLGKKHSLNYSELLTNGVPYLIEVYRKNYLSNSPLHLDFHSIVASQTDINLNHLQNSINEYNRLVIPLNKLTPGITPGGVLISNITEASFKRYLMPGLNDYYKYLVKLLKVANELQEYVTVNNTNAHLTYFVGNGLLCVGNKLDINNKFFQDEL